MDMWPDALAWMVAERLDEARAAAARRALLRGLRPAWRARAGALLVRAGQRLAGRPARPGPRAAGGPARAS